MKKRKIMSRRFLALLLTLVMCLGMMNPAAVAAESDDAEQTFIESTDEEDIVDVDADEVSTEEGTLEEETGEGETSEDGATEEETEEGETSEDGATEGETEEGETSEDGATEGETEEGEISEDGATEGETEEGETSEDGATEGETEEGETSEDGATEGETEEGETSEDGATEEEGENLDSEETEGESEEGEPGEEEGIEGENTEEITEEEIPVQVKAFVDAVAALPELTDVNEDNYEVVLVLGEVCLKAFEALEPEDWEREDVNEALVKLQSLMEEAQALALVLNPPVANVGGIEYSTLAAAVEAAEADATITFMEDIAEDIIVDKSLTFDLKEHTWTGLNDTTLTVATSGLTSDITVTVQNGSMTSVPGYRSIETFPSTANSNTCKADIEVSNMKFTTSGSISNEPSVTSSVGRAGGVIYVENGDLVVTNCTFDGAAGVNGSHIAITPRIATVVNLTISKSTFSGADSNGGAIWASVLGTMPERAVNVDIRESKFTNNKCGLYCKVENSSSVAEISVNLYDCIFSENTGTAIYTYGQSTKTVKLKLEDTEITGNSGEYGLRAELYTDITINGGKISNNTVNISVVEIQSGSFKMDDTEVSNNSGNKVLRINASTIDIENSIFCNNKATATDGLSMGGGGPVMLRGFTDHARVYNTEFVGNTAKNFGGALCVYNTSTNAASLRIDGCKFTENTSDGSGGAIYADNKGGITISDTIITNNAANGSGDCVGGGLYVTNTTGTVTLLGTTKIYANKAGNASQVPVVSVGTSADIALASSKLSTKNSDESAYTRATLDIRIETSFVAEDGNRYSLTRYDRTSYSSSPKYSWPEGYYTVTREPVQVFLGTEQHKHTDENAKTVMTLAAAVEMARPGDTIYVCGNFIVDEDSVSYLNNNGITFARCSEHYKGYMFTIKGEVTLDEAHIDGKHVESDSAMISVPANAHLIIAGETVIENGSNPEGNGGAINVNGGSLTMESGLITNNTAKRGGGIYANSNASGSINFEGGMISGNLATGGERDGGGGGAYIGGAVSSNFGVNGGSTTFDGNNSESVGGGVYINSQNSGITNLIYKAIFTNNKTHRGDFTYYEGGAIYIQTGTTVQMRNVYVSGNTNGDTTHMGFTAVEVCPTGNLAIYDLAGLLSVNNGSDPDIGVNSARTTSTSTSPTNPRVYLASHTIGGGEVSYRKSDGTVVDIADYQFMEGYFSLYTKAPDSVISDAQKKAESDGVIIIGNYANKAGSGIMTNGILKIGIESKSLKVVKKWDDENEKHENDQILVYLTKYGEIVPQDFRSDSSVILNKDNNWSYTWTNLGDGDGFEWGVVEASVGGYMSEVEVKKDTQFSDIADKYYIATITNTKSDEPSRKWVITKVAYGLDPDASYEFTLKLDKRDNVGDKQFALQIDGTLYPIYNNEITFFLKNGQSAVVDGLPEGVTPQVTETEDNDYLTYIFESETLDVDGSITNVFVCNISKINVPVQKYWDKDVESVRPDSIIVTLMDGEDEVDSAPLNKSNGWYHLFTDLPEYNAAGEKISYTVKESEIEGYNVEYGTDGATLTITNTRKFGDLTIQKSVEGLDGAENTKEHTFIFTIEAVGEALKKEVSGKTFKTVNGEDIQFTTDGKATVSITVEGNQASSVTIKNLPTGKYSVTEEERGTEIKNHVLSVLANNAKTKTVEVTVEADSTKEVSVTFTNTYMPYGSLTIHKLVVADPESAAMEKVYTFTIAGKDTANKTYETNNGEVTFNDEGVATITIKGTGSVTLKNLPLGDYTVTEIGDAGIENYTWTVSVSVGDGETNEGTNEGTATVTADDAAEVTIINTYVPYGSLTITKEVVGGPEDAATEKVYTFTVTGKDANDNPVTGPYTMGKDTVTFDKGKATVTIQGASSITIEGLPLGEYIISEDIEQAGIGSYRLNVEGNGVSVELEDAGQNAGATVTNSYTKTTSLTVNKVWSDGADRHVDGSVTVNIMNGTEIVDTVILNARNNWTATVEGLAADQSYTAVEVAVEGYTPSYKNNEDGSITITNIYNTNPEPETTSLTVRKVWSDGAYMHVNGSVTVDIIGGGIVRTVILNAANNWTATVYGLTKGLDYTVREVEVEGYTPSYTTNADGSITITNTYDEPEVTPTPTPTPEVTPTPTPEVTPTPTPEVTPTPTPEVTPTPTPEVTPTPTPEVTPTPTPEVEIPDEEPPLGDPDPSPTPTPEPTPEIDIPDEEPPLGSPDPSPKTGDSTVTWLWAVLALLSAGIVMVLLPNRKRQK